MTDPMIAASQVGCRRTRPSGRRRRKPGEEPAEEGAGDADDRGDDEPAGIVTRQQSLRERACKQAENDESDDSHCVSFVLASTSASRRAYNARAPILVSADHVDDQQHTDSRHRSPQDQRQIGDAARAPRHVGFCRRYINLATRAATVEGDLPESVAVLRDALGDEV